MNHLRNLKAIGTVAYVATSPFVMERFNFSFAKMMAYNSSHLESWDKFIYYERQQISWIPRGRNDLANTLRGDWLFMLDADLEFDPDVLERMLYIMDKYKAPVLTGLYVQKGRYHVPVLYSHNEARGVYEAIVKWPKNTEIFRVDAAGAGCLLIKKEIFDRIWFRLNEDPFDVIAKFGEDFSFFDRLNRAGVGVYVAPQIQFTHLGVQGYEYSESAVSTRFLHKSSSK